MAAVLVLALMEHLLAHRRWAALTPELTLLALKI
jgi:hypothetical protein